MTRSLNVAVESVMGRFENSARDCTTIWKLKFVVKFNPPPDQKGHGTQSLLPSNTQLAKTMYTTAAATKKFSLCFKLKKMFFCILSFVGNNNEKKTQKNVASDGERRESSLGSKNFFLLKVVQNDFCVIQNNF